jgi:4-hydroxybenzoate polyprenyltransferase/phosphoserine phosphatase
MAVSPLKYISKISDPGSGPNGSLKTPNILCVDLDGSLIATDTLWESILLLIKNDPKSIIRMPLWLFKGKAFFKDQIAHRVSPNPKCLPYREEVLQFIKQEKAVGRKIVLATAANRRIAEDVASHLGLFSTVLASDKETNLSGKRKLKMIKEQAGGKEFDYVGDSSVDLKIWESANKAILVKPSTRLLKKANRTAKVDRIFQFNDGKYRQLFKAIRAHQWVKNLLLFVPLIVGHKITDIKVVIETLYAFMAFSLCASSVYIINDLLDLESDRQHPQKRNRPFASGKLKIQTGILLIPLLMFTSFAISTFLLTPLFSLMLVLYLIATTAYSLHLKRVVILDVLVLAGLYAFRVLAGGVASNITVSPWLLAFSVFLFLSLAFVKRYAELRIIQTRNLEVNPNRGYMIRDAEILRSMGSTSGYLSVLVLVLYINSNDVVLLYKQPTVLWLVGICLLYWITRIWLIADRGEMEDDPIAYTIKNRTSYIIGAIIAGVIIIATI